MRHGGKILADQLAIQGVKVAFTVPGESFLAALDGLYDAGGIETIICRQEGGASIMAEAWGKATGEPGICFVTRGPGAANAMSGLHIAHQDSTPLIMFLGLPASDTEDREAFQEIATTQLFSSFVKWVGVIRDTNRIPEYVSRAFHTARAGRPGPVVLGCRRICWRRKPTSRTPKRPSSRSRNRRARIWTTCANSLSVHKSR